jgi:hypothetical protein
MKEACLAVELLETCHVRNTFKIMPVKTDRKDARAFAQLIRMGYSVRCHRSGPGITSKSSSRFLVIRSGLASWASARGKETAPSRTKNGQEA